jgi:hypothetical protein
MRIACVIAVLCIGCSSTPSDQQLKRVPVSSLLYAVDDSLRGNTCYVYMTYGVSCVPMRGR